MEKVTEEELNEAFVNKIKAIKMYRERTGASLADAKRIIEFAMANSEKSIVDKIKKIVADSVREFEITEHLDAPLLRGYPTYNKILELQKNREDLKSRLVSILKHNLMNNY